MISIVDAGDGGGCLMDDLGVIRHDGFDAPPHTVAQAYFLWLCQQVNLNGGSEGPVEYRTPETDEFTYFTLASKLHHTKFNVLVFRDENREEQGRQLRERFAYYNSDFNDYSAINKHGASMLEVLVAMVQRFDTFVMMPMIDEVDRSMEWFWLMMKNASLDIYTDEGFNHPDNRADELCDGIIRTINNRTYDYDGTGGFFPLKKPDCDQRKVELWLQMHEYFRENFA